MKRWYNYPKYTFGDRCRFCPHVAFAHMEVKNFGTENQESRWDKCGLLGGSNDTCDCVGFAPLDNLDYLEITADER
jgi:hypothetical protein